MRRSLGAAQLLLHVIIVLVALCLLHLGVVAGGSSAPAAAAATSSGEPLLPDAHARSRALLAQRAVVSRYSQFGSLQYDLPCFMRILEAASQRRWGHEHLVQSMAGGGGAGARTRYPHLNDVQCAAATTPPSPLGSIRSMRITDRAAEGVLYGARMLKLHGVHARVHGHAHDVQRVHMGA